MDSEAAGDRPTDAGPGARREAGPGALREAGRWQPAPGGAAGIDVPGLVMRVRRAGDLSQRELAAAVGRAQSQIARVEGGRSIVSLELLERILDLAGMRLAVIDGDGVEVRPIGSDSIRDGAGRRMPAHLDVRTLADRPRSAWLTAHREAVRRTAWYHQRAERDRRRARSEHRVDDQPTQRERELDARAQLGRRASGSVRGAATLAEMTCECPDRCWESRGCVDICECRCGG